MNERNEFIRIVSEADFEHFYNLLYNKNKSEREMERGRCRESGREIYRECAVERDR